MSNETEKVTKEENETNQPDFIAKQYRVVALEEGYKTRAEIIGAAWNTEKGIMFRPSGKQIIEYDVYLFPTNK